MTLNALKCNHLMPLRFKGLINITQSSLSTFWVQGSNSLKSTDYVPDIPANQSACSSSAVGHRTLRKYNTAVGILSINARRLVLLHRQRIRRIHQDCEEIWCSRSREKPNQKVHMIAGSTSGSSINCPPNWQGCAATGMFMWCSPQWCRDFPTSADWSLGAAVGNPDDGEVTSIQVARDIAMKCSQCTQLRQTMNGNDQTWHCNAIRQDFNEQTADWDTRLQCLDLRLQCSDRRLQWSDPRLQEITQTAMNRPKNATQTRKTATFRS